MEPDGLEEWERGDHRLDFGSSTSIAYLVYTGVYQIIFLLVMIQVVRNLISEFKQSFVDYLNFTQIIFIILYLLSRNIYGIICLIQVPGIEFFHVPVLALTTFFFYYFIVINNISWYCFIIHLNAAVVPSDLTPEVLKKIKTCEKTITLICFSIGIFLFASWVILMITSFSLNCDRSKLYHIGVALMSRECGIIQLTARIYTTVCIVVGGIATITKCVLGIIILKKMKKKLNFCYKEDRKLIISTIILTVCTMGFNTLTNSINHFSENIWLLYILNAESVTAFTLTYKTLISFVNSLLEILLMVYTSKSIDFRYYILILLQGRCMIGYSPNTYHTPIGTPSMSINISIFLKLRKYFPNSFSGRFSNTKYMTSGIEPLSVYKISEEEQPFINYDKKETEDVKLLLTQRNPKLASTSATGKDVAHFRKKSSFNFT
ncbi:unnamed protein product [Moneuplotes crassus]|uniref:Uncharacterized protein n=1 Tax=Euplotes crassus TaxID=5936 RepID=A0AAD1UJ77_EUPCR|nr:unnamed protein product [Moneuplotes crassus]